MPRNVHRLFSPIRKLLCTVSEAGDVSRSVLILRLENTEVLGRLLDKTALSHLLVQLSMTLGRAVRHHDPLQIIAPGLFAFILRNRTDQEALHIARRLQQQGQMPVPLSGTTVTPVMSGVLVHAQSPDLPDLGALMINARRRMEMVDGRSLGQLSLFTHDPKLAGPELVATVSDAVRAEQIEAWFQPQVSCHTGRITGFEALARWNHPQRGVLAPGAFMPQMSDADHNNLTLCMLAQSLAALRSWDEAGFDVPTVSINISNCELSDAGFADCLLWELDRHDIPPRRLVVEVLESVGPLTSSAETRANLRKLAEAGCQIDLDDFGTGYASLDAIRQFGINRIKIDRSFVTACDIDPNQQRMILAILALAERLGIATLAEGVETREEYGFLAQMGCDEVQGYAISRPVPLNQSFDFLARHRTSSRDLPTIARHG
ncbi:MAG: EAL domain-containing protein [Paracoccus sp. (in: a-proteobacteria)]|uniref:EAL domain-containing protein n=1 Tax=Paracoccus sp. TaxID=267 RepID=UPI002E84ADFC|nr:EAL domain-containing protein [Pseudomonadota bacterium]